MRASVGHRKRFNLRLVGNITLRHRRGLLPIEQVDPAEAGRVATAGFRRGDSHGKGMVLIAVQAGEYGLTASWEDPLTGQASTSDDAFQGVAGQNDHPDRHAR